MTAINFPDTPTVGQTFTVGDITWQWDGSVWKSATATGQSLPLAHAESHEDGGSDEVTIAQSQVINLTTDLAAKASNTHTHIQSDITNLTTDLAAKANTTGALLISTKLQSPIEKVALVSHVGGNTVNLNLAQASVWLNTSSTNASFVINVQGATGNLISELAAGESVTLSYVNSPNSTTSYPTGIQIDGSNVASLNWQGGAPTSTLSFTKDVYTINITKVYANATGPGDSNGVRVLASASNFKA